MRIIVTENVPVKTRGLVQNATAVEAGAAGLMLRTSGLLVEAKLDDGRVVTVKLGQYRPETAADREAAAA